MAISGERFVTMGDAPSTADDDEDEYLLCFNVESGKQIWKTHLGDPWNRHGVHGIALAVYRVVSIVPFFVPIGPVIVFIVIVHVPMVSGFVSW